MQTRSKQEAHKKHARNILFAELNINCLEENVSTKRDKGNGNETETETDTERKTEMETETETETEKTTKDK
jgi:hypothetical protein